MTNKYLEKIAEWKDMGHGIYSDGVHYGVNKETGDKFVKEHNRNHHMNALKILPASFGAMGAGMAAAAAGKQWLSKPKLMAKKTSIIGVAGAGLGLALAPILANAGNKQVPRETKINNRIYHYMSGGD